MSEEFTADPRLQPSARIAESAIYSGLATLFEINTDASVVLAEQVMRQMSGYVADMALLEGTEDSRKLAADSLKRLKSDIASLISHLEASDTLNSGVRTGAE